MTDLTPERRALAEELRELYIATEEGGAHGLLAVYDRYCADTTPEPRPIDPADIKPGMKVRGVEHAGGAEYTFTFTVDRVIGEYVYTVGVERFWNGGRTWYLLADAPDPDAELVETMAMASYAEDYPGDEWAREPAADAYRSGARAALAALREAGYDVTRAER